MPRHKRIDIPGAIHHVINRGVGRQDIFLDDTDRAVFLSRLDHNLATTGARCYAWALLSNHFHLLIRTGEKCLSELMRKLLTGYAIYFNRRHYRSGYLFQNRYKSILCQEDVYFQELVRYIHLNPLRAGLVESMDELDRFPWSGHAVLLNRKRRPWQERNEVLSLFGERKQEAARRYRDFVAAGIEMGRQPRLTGGGLRRSAGGWEMVAQRKEAGEVLRGDERLLGDSGFVERILHLAEENLTRRENLVRQGWDLQRLVEETCRMFSVEAADLRKKGRANAISTAKSLVCFWGKEMLGISGAELARYFGISRPAISRAARKGEQIAKKGNFKLIN